MACGWCFPTSVRSRLILRRMFALGVWMRAMICSRWGSWTGGRGEARRPTYLGDDFQPSVDLDHDEAIAHGLAHVHMIAVLEPQREQPKSVLKRVLVPKVDRFEES